MSDPNIVTPEQISHRLSFLRYPVPLLDQSNDEQLESLCDLTKPVGEILQFELGLNVWMVIWHGPWWIISTANGIADRPAYLQTIAHHCPLLTLEQWNRAADGHIKFLTPEQMTRVTLAENEGREPDWL